MEAVYSFEISVNLCKATQSSHPRRELSFFIQRVSSFLKSAVCSVTGKRPLFLTGGNSLITGERNWQIMVTGESKIHRSEYCMKNKMGISFVLYRLTRKCIYLELGLLGHYSVLPTSWVTVNRGFFFYC